MVINFGYVVDNEIAGCAHPDSLDDAPAALLELHDRGFEALVSLDEYGISPDLAAEHGFAYLHVPIPDFQPPLLHQAEEFVKFVDDQRDANRQVAVHCHSGYGRTGTMIACWLISRGNTADEAMNIVRTRRPGSIETRSQEKFLHEFEHHFRRNNPELDRRRSPRG